VGQRREGWREGGNMWYGHGNSDSD
jgi:hypothetical protein